MKNIVLISSLLFLNSCISTSSVYEKKTANSNTDVQHNDNKEMKLGILTGLDCDYNLPFCSIKSFLIRFKFMCVDGNKSFQSAVVGKNYNEIEMEIIIEGDRGSSLYTEKNNIKIDNFGSNIFVTNTINFSPHLVNKIILKTKIGFQIVNPSYEIFLNKELCQ